jgi:hypothetical protein
MVAQFPGSHNVFVRDHESSGRLVVDFSRNVKDFALNSYCQLQPAKKVAGYYREVTVEEAGRILNTDLAEFAWHDGTPAPNGYHGTESFEFKDFRCDRYTFGVTLGDLTIDQASWDIVNEYQAKKAQQAMTARTQAAITELTASGNYDATHTSAVSSISGNTGNWADSTVARQDIKRSLNFAADLILKDTLAAVDVNDLMIVINPTLAKDMAISQEMVDHIKGSPDALAQIRGELPGRNAIFGLPDKIYGFPVVVEKTVKVTTFKGASSTSKSYVLPSATPFMCARPGGLEGKFGAPTFSTCVIFMLEEMTTETLRKPEDRLTQVRVVENYDAKVVAPVSGFLFTGATS